MMKLKPAILAVLDRHDLKRLVDDLDIAEVDRRSAEAMRAVLARSRKAVPEVLLGYARKEQLTEACRALGVASTGRREEIVGRLLGNGEVTTKKEAVPKRRNIMATDGKKNNGTTAPAAKKPKKLTLARLESLLFKACDILRGNMDASEFKEYIFGMLFLKRMSDQFDHDRAALEADYRSKGMKPELIEKQLANPDKYDFFVPDQGHTGAISAT